MLIDTVKKYYDKKYDLNCAECMMVSASEEYELDLSKQTIKVMSAFGGGMGVGSVCGAITGSIAILGVMFTEDRGHASPHVKQMTIEYISKFNDELGTIDCIPLKNKYVVDTQSRCSKMMEVAAKVLEETVEKYKEEYPVYR